MMIAILKRIGDFLSLIIYMESSQFFKTNASFMISIAHIPFYCFSFRGLICVLIIDNKEYHFTTYNNTKII